MNFLRRHRWFVAAAGVSLAYAGVSLIFHQSPGLTAFSEIFGFSLMLAAAGVMLANAITRPGAERSFWALLFVGFSFWAFNQGAWAYNEVLLRRDIPDPYFSDIILFFHFVPIIAAVAWRPDFTKSESRFHLSTLNFLMLFVWWIFLYAFVVFPHQYVVLNLKAYDYYYDLLYQIESVLLMVILALAAWTGVQPWRRLYLNFLIASLVYSGGSLAVNAAVVQGRYYSGSLYDVPLFGTVCWMMATALSARQWELKSQPPVLDRRWKLLMPQLAILAILSLPVLGIWTYLEDKSPAPSRIFRLFVVLTAMLVLGAFTFLRQYIQDQTLMQFLMESRHTFEHEQRLQTHLVQKEKLASLGHLVAGAAQEINHPVATIMSHAERLWSNERLADEQTVLVRKIFNQARRTRDLVSDLMSFSQQTPAQKTPVDLAILITRGVLMFELQQHSGKIRVETFVEPQTPLVWGNANQLFQTFVHIIENAFDAMEDAGGGVLQISAQRHHADVVVQFSDSGPGIREPQRVFDPFYTTKPIGKGTGLGLSAVYGVIQDHNGQITCQNKSEGGALFILRLPAAPQRIAQAAASAKA
jgi:signal transduction histidine kinase